MVAGGVVVLEPDGQRGRRRLSRGSAVRRPIRGRVSAGSARPCRCAWACAAGSGGAGCRARRAARAASGCGCRSRRCRSAGAAAVMPWPAKNASARSTKAVTVCGALVGVHLGVGQAAVVVDDRVAELPADARALLGAGAVAIAGDLVPGPAEAREALGVHLQQIAGARPLKAPDRLARRAAASATARGASDSGLTVACAIPSSDAINRGPQPVRRAPRRRGRGPPR